MAYDLSRLKVMIVEDDATMKLLLRSILHAFGVVHFDTCNSAGTALQRLPYFAPDLIVCDQRMEPVDGLEFVRIVRRETEQRYVPILMVSAYSEMPYVMAARDAGVSEYLAKPLTIEALYARLRVMIERPRLFVNVASYIGPDRRRRDDPRYTGPERRNDALDIDDIRPSPLELWPKLGDGVRKAAYRGG